jgi:hypothetical protein
MTSIVWDSGQRHTARPWLRIGVLAVVLVMDLVVIACAPFILANTDDPVAVWIVFAILAIWTLKLLLEGHLRQSVQLERVTVEDSGLVLAGSRLTIWGTAYRAWVTHVGWADVRSVDVVDVGRENRVSSVVDIRLGVPCPVGTEVRLVHLSRARAQAFADNALALRTGVAQRRWAFGAPLAQP